MHQSLISQRQCRYFTKQSEAIRFRDKQPVSYPERRSTFVRQGVDAVPCWCNRGKGFDGPKSAASVFSTYVSSSSMYELVTNIRGRRSGDNYIFLRQKRVHVLTESFLMLI